MGKPIFSPIPARAIGDHRLSARHWRVLGAVSYHDRFSKNGQGCWAGRKRLAQEAMCSETHVSDALSDLRAFGYITSEPHPMNRRTTVHRVVHGDSVTVGVTPNGESNRSRIRDLSRTAPEQVPTWNRKSLNEQGIGVSNILGRNPLRNSAEAAWRQSESVTENEAVTYLDEVEQIVLSPDLRAGAQCETARLAIIANDESLSSNARERAAVLRALIAGQ